MKQLYVVIRMYVAITCIMTCSISKGFVTYHGSLECEINYNYDYNHSAVSAILSSIAAEALGAKITSS